VNELSKYVLYFLLGGTLVSVSTYLGSHGRGFFAALASTLPVISGMTFILIYLNAGTGPTVSFAKNLIWLSPPWFAYVFTMMFGVPRFGFAISFAMAMTFYVLLVFVIRVIVR
jgi:hypothetical protein